MMKLKFYFILLALSGLPVYVFAQIDFRQFSLDSFKLPDIDRRAMEFSGSILGNMSAINFKSTDTDLNQSRFSQSLSLNYSRFLNRADIQASKSFSIQNAYSSSKSDFSLLVQENSEVLWSPRINLSYVARKYQDRRFTMLGYDAHLDYDYEKGIGYTLIMNNPPMEFVFRDRDLFTLVSGTIGFGKGRIEGISFVTMAMFLLQDAEDLGVDLSGLAIREIYDFAARMAVLRNQRIFDNRRMRIDELRQLYNFMIDQDWVLRDDPGFFTVLTDNWLYNNAFSRSTGRRTTFSFTPFLEYIDSKYSADPGATSNVWNVHYGAEIGLDVEKYKPLHLHKDWIKTHSLSFGINFPGTESNVNFPAQSSYISAMFDNTIGWRWHPNNRTQISTTVFADFIYYRFLEEPELIEKPDQLAVNTGVEGQANYFISYRTRLIVDARFFYGINNGGRFLVFFPGPYGTTAEASGFEVRLNATLAVSIF